MHTPSPRQILEQYQHGQLSRRDAMDMLGLECPYAFYDLLKRLRIPVYMMPESDSADMVSIAADFLTH